MVIATHDMQLVCQFAERVIVLTGGEVIGDAAPDEVFMDEDAVARSGICPPEIFQMGRALDCRARLLQRSDEFLACFPRMGGRTGREGREGGRGAQ